jgi:hypothetical protein
LLEQNDEGASQRRRCVTLETLAAVDDNLNIRLSTVTT